FTRTLPGGRSRPAAQRHVSDAILRYSRKWYAVRLGVALAANLFGVEELHTDVQRNQQFLPNYGKLSQRGTDRVRLCGVGGESGGEQTNGQAPTDAVEPTRRASAAADPHASAQ